MPDRRTVDELTIEELEQILIIKRRESRAGRMQRLRDVGRIPGDAALPSEDLASIPVATDRTDPGGRVDPSGRWVFDVEPLKGAKRRGRPNKQRQRPPVSRWGRVRDQLLLVLEIGALAGLAVVLVLSLANLNALNEEYAEAKPLPTPSAAVQAADLLPSGHTPPEEPGNVPIHLRDLVEGDTPPIVTIPTPGPEAPSRVVIPSIEVDALIVEGDSWEQLKLGVGHHLNSANPGERGNMVLSAHNDIYGEIFRRLDDLELGDDVVVYADKQPYRYVVTAKQIVEPTEVSVLAPTTKPVVTLISCYPYMVDTHRIVVVAELQ